MSKFNKKFGKLTKYPWLLNVRYDSLNRMSDRADGILTSSYDSNVLANLNMFIFFKFMDGKIVFFNDNTDI